MRHQFLEQDPGTPAIQQQVMKAPDDLPAVRRQLRDRKAERRRLLQNEGLGSVFLHHFRSFVSRDHPEVKGRIRKDHLHRLGQFPPDEHRPENVVTRLQVFPGLLKPGQVQFSGHGKGHLLEILLLCAACF